MLVWNLMIEKPNKILKGVKDSLNKKDIAIDGVVDVFNDGKEKGMLLKIFDKYDETLDWCVWVYQPANRVTNNEVKVMFGTHDDILPNNLWKRDLPSKIIERKEYKEMHNLTRDYIVDEILEKFHYDIKI